MKNISVNNWKKVMSKGVLTLILAPAFLAVISCHRSYDDNLGPNKIGAPEGFKVTTPVTTGSSFINLSTTTQTFNATLSDSVSWKLDLVGYPSGAHKEFTGTSKNISLNWNGGNDGIYFFRELDSVAVTLSFFGTSLVDTAWFRVQSPKDLSTQGFLLSDYEKPPNGTYAGFNFPFSDPGESNFNDYVTDSSTQLSDLGDALYPPSKNVRAVQGRGFHYASGRDLPVVHGKSSTFYIQGFGYKTAWTNQPPFFPTLTDPEQLWFNIYVYGFGTKYGNTKFQISFDEDENGIPDWQPLTDEELIYPVKVNWTGWRLISFKYSDALFSAVYNNGSDGNNIREPNKLMKIGIIQGTDPSIQPAKFAYDYAIFTFGRPFNPDL